MCLPGFPEGAAQISSSLSLLIKEGKVFYMLGSDNYFSHDQGELAGQQFALTSLISNRYVRATDIERSFLKIPHRTLMRWLAQYRELGPGSFFIRHAKQKPRVMTDERVAECTSLLAVGLKPGAVATRVGIGESTLRKAMARRQIVKPEGISETVELTTTKGERSRTDALAAEGIGTACTRADERMSAALGLAQSTATRFEAAADVSMGGLLTGLPALCANGLLSGIDKYLKLPVGFYSCLHILFILGFMALARIRRPEGLRTLPPGEFGRVVGLDRVPEVRTLRQKITVMAQTGDTESWMQELSKSWMESDPDEAGYLYIDGHVRVYHGSKAVLPRRFVSRERLCLRGTTDYWLNDAIGRPFFVVSKAVTSGLSDTLLHDIMPKLLASVPNQPTEEQLFNNPMLHRFVMVFDREGSTGSMAEKLWEDRVAMISYRKNVKDRWPELEFIATDVAMPDGTKISMKLATRETMLGRNMPVKEVRRLTQTGHQTAVISTARCLDNVVIASRMFSRWSQENFFAYMMQHYDIDGLVQYGTEKIPGTQLIINPSWRQLDKQVCAARQQLLKKRAQFKAATAMESDADLQRNAECLLDIQNAEQMLIELRAKRKATDKKVTIESLPENEQPTKLLPLNKMLSDIIKMIAYRSEMAIVTILRKYLNKQDDAHALARELFVSSADLVPDAPQKTLTVKIHRMASPVHDKAIASLLEELNEINFCHPENGDRMIYKLG
jgi:hypothetical protein